MHKILFFIPSLCNSGGTERISTILANNLVSRGICVDFVVHSVTIDSFFDLDDSIHIYSLGGTYSVFSIQFFSLLLPLSV